MCQFANIVWLIDSGEHLQQHQYQSKTHLSYWYYGFSSASLRHSSRVVSFVSCSLHFLWLTKLSGPSDLSFWYQYSELATRGAIFYSMSTLAGAFNGLIAYGITKNLDGANGWKAWRWIFLIEGILPCAFAFVVLFLLPASPESLRFGFSPEEKALIIRRARTSHNTSEAKLQMKKIPLVLMTLHFWLLLAIACCGHFCIGSMSNFLPAIIEVK